MANDDQPAAPEPAENTGAAEKKPGRSSRLWSAFKSAMKVVRTIPAGRMLALVLVAVLLLSPIAGGLFWQRLQSQIDDIGWFYDPSKEGLIVVDSPQVFTRERLVNQRLRDSAWIDRQLEAVDQKLKDGDFSKPDILQSQEQSLHLLQQSLNGGGSENADLADAGETEGANAGAAPNANLESLLSLIEPDPISVFRDAQFYREMLTQSRYEAILDDAHDIGSNTLQKLNFRMTITPARRKSDSLAAVTITIEEPKDVEHLFQYYGKLLIETREEVEDTVRRLIQDRSLVLRRGARYAYSDRIAALLNQVLDERFKASFGSRPSQEMRTLAINAASELEQRQRLSNASGSLRASIMQVREVPGLARLLYPVQGRTVRLATNENRDGPTPGTHASPPMFERIAPRIARQNCNRNLSLLDLAAPVFEDPDLLDQMRLEFDQTFAQNELLQRLKANRNRAMRGDPPLAPKPVTDLERTEIMDARFSDFLNTKRFGVPCPQDNQIHTRARLRVIGALRLLQSARGQEDLCTDATEEDKAAVIRHTLSLFMGASEGPQKIACGINTRKLMAQRPVGLSGWDIGTIGVSYLVQAELATTPIDSMIRVRNLSDYFRFNIDSCSPLSCSVTVRTLAEEEWYQIQNDRSNGAAEADPAEQAVVNSVSFIEATPDKLSEVIATTPANPDANRPSPAALITESDRDKIREIGREEALRLYAELSCFARARSYTVWPRSGETKRALNSNSSQIAVLGDLLSAMTAGANAKSTSASFKETQHVFGIGDGGQPVVSTFPECDAPFYWMLDRFEPNGEFVSDFAKLNGRKWQSADPSIEAWRNRVMCRIANQKQGHTTLSLRQLTALTTGQRARVLRDLDGTQLDQLEKTQATELKNPQVFALRADLTAEEFDKIGLKTSSGIPGWGILDCNQNPATLAAQIESRDIDSFVKHVTIGDFMAITRSQRNYDTNVSWIVIPEQESPLTPKRHVAKSVPLSAIVSLPSWWPSARITIRTCWMRPKAMRSHMSGADFCKTAEGVAENANMGVGASNQMTQGYGAQNSESVFPVRLPSNAQDVLQKLGFFIIRAPYLDNQSTNQEVFVVQAGRSAAIRLTGKRLWKNPRVRLGNQWHDEIEVLPDMKGIIARFNCVEPTSDAKLDAVEWRDEVLIDTKTETKMPDQDNQQRSGPSQNRSRPSSSGENRMARVWTSEGATSFAEVTILPFRPSYVENGVHEKPCWPEQKAANAALETGFGTGE